MIRAVSMGGGRCGRQMFICLDNISTVAGYLPFRQVPGCELHGSVRADSEFLR